MGVQNVPAGPSRDLVPAAADAQPAAARRRGRLTLARDAPEERYFERRQIKEAIAFAEGGGIAVHRNFDHYHGSTIRGVRREKPFLHVIGRREVLQEWGLRHGLRPEWIQPEKHRSVAHYDVFGTFAEQLIERLRDRPPGAS